MPYLENFSPDHPNPPRTGIASDAAPVPELRISPEAPDFQSPTPQNTISLPPPLERGVTPDKPQTLEEKIAPYEAAMGPYADASQAIGRQLRDGRPAEKIRGHIGSGEQKHAFRVGTHAGAVVVKHLHDGTPLRGVPTRPTRNELHTDIAPLIAGAGLEGHEQLKAVDVENGVIVTDERPGEMIHKVKPRVLKKMSAEHLIQLGRRLALMSAHGLHPHNVEGILYDKKEGFSFVDYTLADKDGNRPQLNPDQPLSSFVDYVLDDWEAVRKAYEKVPPFSDPREAKYYKPDVRPDPARVKAKEIILKRIGELGLK